MWDQDQMQESVPKPWEHLELGIFIYKIEYNCINELAPMSFSYLIDTTIKFMKTWRAIPDRQLD